MKEFILSLSVSSISIAIVLAIILAIWAGIAIMIMRNKRKRTEKYIDRIVGEYANKVRTPLEDVPKNALERQHTSFKEYVQGDQEEYSTDHIGTVSKLIKKADLYIAKKDFTKASEMLIMALSEDPENSEVIKKLATLYLKDKLYFKAETLFIKLLEQGIKDAIIYTNLGHSFYFQKKFQLAREAYEKAILLDKDATQRYYPLAQVLKDLGEVQEAINTLRSIQKKEKGKKEFWYLLRDFHHEINHKDGLIEALEQLTKMEPFNRDHSKWLQKLKN